MRMAEFKPWHKKLLLCKKVFEEEVTQVNRFYIVK